MTDNTDKSASDEMQAEIDALNDDLLDDAILEDDFLADINDIFAPDPIDEGLSNLDELNEIIVPELEIDESLLSDDDFEFSDNDNLYSVEIERALIGALITGENNNPESQKLKPTSFYKTMEYVEATHFYDRANRITYGLLQGLNRQGKSPDESMVKAMLVAEFPDEFDAEDVDDYFIGFKPLACSKVNDYSQLIIELWGKRKVINEAEKFVEDVRSGGKTLDEAIQSHQSGITKVTNGRGSDVEIKTYNGLKNGLLKKMKENAESGSLITGQSTKIHELDALTSGLQDTDLIIVAGRPSMGKTTLACNIMDAIAERGERTLTFSYEMPADQLLLRSWASVGSINQTALRSGRLTDFEQGRLMGAMEKTDGFNALVIDDSNITARQMCAIARREHEIEPIRAIMVDYLQLIKDQPGVSSKNESVSDMSREFKSLAKDLQCPVILLSQLNRSLEQRADKRP
ncbi:replicative DNA helicase, partial [Vibrio splendidus]